VSHGHVHAVPIDERLTRCDECGQATRTLGALCENCSAVKDPPERQRLRIDFDTGIGWVLWYVPVLVLLGVAVFALASPTVIVLAVALLLAPLVWQVWTSGDHEPDHH